MRRRVFIAVALVALAICLASLAAWPLSYRSGGMLALGGGDGAWGGGVVWQRGVMSLSLRRSFFEPGLWLYDFAPNPPPRSGFDMATTRTGGFRVQAPLWFGVLITGTLAWVSWRAARPKPTGGCRACDYDLSGSPESATCPECGAELMATAA